MEIESRRIVHWGVTTSPTLQWVKHQLREATPWGETPRFLIHDNDGVFGQYKTRPTVRKDGKKRSYRCHLDLWLHTVMDIEGIPIPYGAPNANAHVERFNRTLREDALDHFIFFGVDHIRKVVSDFVEFYNRARPSQAIHGIPDPYPELRRPARRDGKLVALPVLGGIHHDYRLAA
ncbi:MAG: integrase core domain-containing protein [Myxococcota bacterium]